MATVAGAKIAVIAGGYTIDAGAGDVADARMAAVSADDFSGQARLSDASACHASLFVAAGFSRNRGCAVGVAGDDVVAVADIGPGRADDRFASGCYVGTFAYALGRAGAVGVAAAVAFASMNAGRRAATACSRCTNPVDAGIFRAILLGVAIGRSQATHAFASSFVANLVDRAVLGRGTFLRWRRALVRLAVEILWTIAGYIAIDAFAGGRITELIARGALLVGGARDRAAVSCNDIWRQVISNWLIRTRDIGVRHIGNWHICGSRFR